MHPGASGPWGASLLAAPLDLALNQDGTWAGGKATARCAAEHTASGHSTFGGEGRNRLLPSVA